MTTHYLLEENKNMKEEIEYQKKKKLSSTFCDQLHEKNIVINKLKSILKEISKRVDLKKYGIDANKENEL